MDARDSLEGERDVEQQVPRQPPSSNDKDDKQDAAHTFVGESEPVGATEDAVDTTTSMMEVDTMGNGHDDSAKNRRQSIDGSTDDGPNYENQMDLDRKDESDEDGGVHPDSRTSPGLETPLKRSASDESLDLDKASEDNLEAMDDARLLQSVLPIGRPINVTRQNFVALYASFLKTYHFKNPAARHCRLMEHFAKFDSPPKNQKRTFETYDFYEVVRDLGGVSQIKSWSDVARRLGFDPRGTNIAARVKDWMVYHHIGAFFDYLLGLPNEFYRHPDDPSAPQLESVSTPGSIKRAGSEDQQPESEDIPPRKRGKRTSGAEGRTPSSVTNGDSSSLTWRFVDGTRGTPSGYASPSDMDDGHGTPVPGHHPNRGRESPKSSRVRSGSASSARSGSGSHGTHSDTETEREAEGGNRSHDNRSLPPQSSGPSGAQTPSDVPDYKRDNALQSHEPSYGHVRPMSVTPNGTPGANDLMARREYSYGDQERYHSHHRPQAMPPHPLQPMERTLEPPYAMTPSSSAPFGHPSGPRPLYGQGSYPPLPGHPLMARDGSECGYGSPHVGGSGDRYPPPSRTTGTPQPARTSASPAPHSTDHNVNHPHPVHPAEAGPSAPGPPDVEAASNHPDATPSTAHLPNVSNLLASQPNIQTMQHQLTKIQNRNTYLEDRNAVLESRCRELGELLRASNEMVRVMREEIGEGRGLLEKVGRVKEMMRGLVQELPGLGPSGGR
ncbi:hypothetical protein SpCBS45565_g03832 [Spizellomyces sp. 'palustris']|nr:hypothetical protein SpCBS45565_g03832 [Spizellomyces sp. 'palustris']